MAKRTANNYLNNRDLVKEIHKSKLSYCYSVDDKYNNYDTIVTDLEFLINNEQCLKTFGVTIEQWFADQIAIKEKRLAKEEGLENLNLTKNDIIVRVMTFAHIPEDKNWGDIKIKKKLSDGYQKVNFPPFIHVIYSDGEFETVLKSHHTKEEKFSINHGDMTAKLGRMFYLLVEKIGQKGNWRNYSYLEDMKSSALLQLSVVGLQFNESRGAVLNPFAFYTTIVYNAFKRVLNSEKKDRDLRDDLLESSGQAPSMNRQISNELDASQHWDMSNGHFREKNKPRRMPKPVAPGEKGMFGRPKKAAEVPPIIETESE